MANPSVFEMVVRKIEVDADAATLELDLPPMPEGRDVPDEWLAKQGAWFAGLNGEVGADEGIRVAIFGDDGRRFSAGKRVRISIEPVSDSDRIDWFKEACARMGEMGYVVVAKSEWADVLRERGILR